MPVFLHEVLFQYMLDVSDSRLPFLLGLKCAMMAEIKTAIPIDSSVIFFKPQR
jgi:hypothetical protein